MIQTMKAILALEDGTVVEGEGWGAEGTALGELVFATPFTGYTLIVLVSWLSVASTILPNNSIDAGNYVVTYLPNNPIIAGIIGGIIGALLSYIVSLKLLKRRLERENAVKFLTEHYLSLLGTLEWVTFAWHIWGIGDTYKEDVRVSDEETTQIFLEVLLKLSQTLESIMRSGTNILLCKIDKQIYSNAVGLDYLIRACLYKISQNQNISDDEITDEINKVTTSIEKLHKALTKMGMPMLIKEYQKIMKDKKPILED